MAMKYIKCPHCGAANGPRAVNEKVAQMSLAHSSCCKCHKRFAWTAEYGRVQVYKD